MTEKVSRPAQDALSTDVAVSFQDVSIAMGGVQILKAVSAWVPRRSVTAIIGPNGAGKTTLLLALLGQIPFQGEIRFGPGLGRREARMAYVPQRLQIDRGMPLTVTELLTMGISRRPLWLGASRKARQRAAARLAEVKAEGLASRPLGRLSAGELQRVLLALALDRDPQILVLDELDAGVDVQAEHLLCELLESLKTERDLTQIMVSHDLPAVMAHATHVICLNRRVLRQGPAPEVLTPQVLEETFGLHRRLPDLAVLAGRSSAGQEEEEARDGSLPSL